MIGPGNERFLVAARKSRLRPCYSQHAKLPALTTRGEPIIAGSTSLDQLFSSQIGSARISDLKLKPNGVTTI